jgi:putative flippase GtrA
MFSSWAVGADMEALRFTVVAIGGVFLDLGIAYSLVLGFGLPLWLAATVGFVVAALVNYVMHELWTFGSATRRPSLRRAAKYVFFSALTLVARLTVVFLLGVWFGSGPVLPILIAGVSGSFVVNYTLSKFLICSHNAPSDTAIKR